MLEGIQYSKNFAVHHSFVDGHPTLAASGKLLVAVRASASSRCICTRSCRVGSGRRLACSFFLQKTSQALTSQAHYLQPLLQGDPRASFN